MNYFVDGLPITTGNRTRLYVDGKDYCADLCADLLAAKQFIFLTGLHFMADYRLIRTGVKAHADSTVARVLAGAGARGVNVYLLVNQFWKDESEIFFYQERPIRTAIGKKGELFGYLPETYKLFQALAYIPNVHCRTDIHPHSAVFGTNHQKTVIIDDEIAYLGGIDLTFLDGDRWDTEKHDVALRDANRTNVFWHDVHMRVEGPARQFVRDNFVQRWIYGDLHTLREKDLSSDPLLSVNVHNAGGALIIEAVKDRVPPALPRFKPGGNKFIYPKVDDEAPKEPTLQIVRSMPNTGVFPITKPLWHQRSGDWDNSCKEAYLTGIRLARRYIYLENQWVSDEDIWAELAAAAGRNKSNPQFRILVMLPHEPLFAAGLGSNQELWIGSEMEKVIKAGHSPATFGVYALVQVRGGKDLAQIYVHSKILIVDDEWALIGSANAGGVSLEGIRSGKDKPDTELSAIIADKAFAADFRRRLWQEHLQRKVSPAYDVHDADQFRRIAAKGSQRVRFFPGYERIKRGVPTWSPVVPPPKSVSLAPFERQSRIVPSFPSHLQYALPPTLITAAFKAQVAPAPPRGYRAWYRWSCELGFTPASGAERPKPGKPFKLRSLPHDEDDVWEYSDHDAAYIGSRTAEEIDRRVSDVTRGRVLCRVQIIPAGEGPVSGNEWFPSLLLSWECMFMNAAFAKANHADFVAYRPPVIKSK